MNRFLNLLILSLMMSLPLVASASSHPPLEVVPSLDLPTYMGRWYSIAAFPQFYESGCIASQADYTLKENGDVEVINSCREKTFDGKWRIARGTGHKVSDETNAKLKLTFFLLFKGDYWVIDLGANYEYSVVASPDYDSLWILSRTRTMDSALLNTLIERTAAKGFDMNRLKMMPQPPEESSSFLQDFSFMQE